MAQIDLLGFISSILSNRQRAGAQRQSADFQNRELDSRVSENALERAARLGEDERRLALERERIANSSALTREELAQRNNQFESGMGFDREKLGVQSGQFGQQLAQSGSQFDQELAQKSATEKARMDLAQQELLASLAEKTGSSDLLDLLGNKFGVGSLGQRMKLAGMKPKDATVPRPAATQWDAISGWIEPQGAAWQSYLASNPSNSATIAAPPRRQMSERDQIMRLLGRG